MTAARGGKKSGKKSSGRSKTTGKRVQEERALAFRRGVNTALIIAIVLMIGFSAWQLWSFIGKPGLPPPHPTDRTACLELYFYDNSIQYLVPVHRSVTLAPRENSTVRAVTEFAMGPKDSYLSSVYPRDIPLPQTSIRDKVAYIDLPPEFMSHWGGTSKERAILDAITLTVAGQGECNSVRILINGQLLDATPEGYDLTEPILPPELINQVPNSSLQGHSQWVTAYFMDSSGRYLLPLTLEILSDTDGPQAAIEKLLSNPPQLAYPPPKPVCAENYKLNKLIIENGIATVDLDVPDALTAFLNSDVNIFRRAVYLTLKKCCNIKDVTIQLNGRAIDSYSRFSELRPVQGEPCWNNENTMINAEVDDLN